MKIHIKNDKKNLIFLLNSDIKEPLKEKVAALVKNKYLIYKNNTDIEISYLGDRVQIIVRVTGEVVSNEEMKSEELLSFIDELVKNVFPHRVDTISNVILQLSDKQKKAFDSLFKIFKNEKRFFNRLINLIENNDRIKWTIHETFTYIGIDQYLMDGSLNFENEKRSILINEEMRKKSTPHFMEWIQNSTAQDKNLLMKILELNLFEIKCFSYDTVFFCKDIEDFFTCCSSSNSSLLLECLKKLQGNERREKGVKERKFINIFVGIKKTNPKLADQEAISLAYNFASRNFFYEQIETLQRLNIPLKEIGKLKEQIGVCAYYKVPFEGNDFSQYCDALEYAVSKEEFMFLLSLDPVSFRFVIKTEETKNGQKIGLRNEQLTSRYSPNQIIYNDMMQHSIEIASSCLQKGHWDSTTFLNYLCMRRHRIAFVQENINFLSKLQLAEGDYRHHFGILREGDKFPDSTCFEAYGPITIELWKYHKAIQEDPFLNPNLCIEQGKLKFLDAIEGKEIALSYVDFSKYDPAKEISKKNCAIVNHTSPENAAVIMKYVTEHLFEEAMKEDNQKKLQEKLGEIFWWICQAKPWERGDPSIAEMFIRTIWDVKGYKNVPWKKGIIPWVEVMKEPDRKAFGKIFFTFFDSES